MTPFIGYRLPVSRRQVPRLRTNEKLVDIAVERKVKKSIRYYCCRSHHRRQAAGRIQKHVSHRRGCKFAAGGSPKVIRNTDT
jgi:hypothetical protein